jgi:hypothetical protein
MLQEHGISHLIRLYDQISLHDGSETKRELLHWLRIFAMCPTEDGTQRVIAAARKPLARDDRWWLSILDQFANSGHPYQSMVFKALSNPLPPSFIGLAFLSCANEVALKEDITSHPFDCPEGVEKLRGWLRDLDPKHLSWGTTATTALPFISEPARSELLQLAMDHPYSNVSLEAAWAAAKVGQERGITLLARYALDVNTSAHALAYLRELNREDAVPAAARDPDFRAMADMVSWLNHPCEYDAVPDAIEQYDTRELFWPPTNDRRRVWLFKYSYEAAGRSKRRVVGLGMVGSVTLSLDGETKADLAPLDAYAIHCCWELDKNDDPRAPKKRSIAAGRELLAKYNPP